MQTRRGVLVAGGACALVLAGLGYRTWDRGVFSGREGVAYAPWRDWQDATTPSTARPLRAAILASSPHNTQPWIFAAGQDSIAVIADRARNLGTFDPFRREMHLGIGAAVENLVLASRAFGLAADVIPVEGKLTLSPDDSPAAAVTVRLTPTPTVRDALFDAIPRRHTNRAAYRHDQLIAVERMLGFADLVTDDVVRVAFIADPGARRELGALIVEATERIIADPQMSIDSARWFRTGKHEIGAHRDGVTLDTSGLSPLMTAVSKLLPDQDATTADRYWLSMTRETHVPTAPLLGIILVRDRLDMRGAIAAGRAWQRLHLAVTVEGLAAQPLNQPVECVDRNAMLGHTDSFGPALAKFADWPGWEPTFVFRLGVADRPAGPSPRRSLEQVLRT